MRDDRFSAGAKPTTDQKGMNDATMPKAGMSASGPKETNDGVSLTTGYKVVKPDSKSVQAVTPNTEDVTPGGRGQPY